jgi:hypothetical protein
VVTPSSRSMHIVPRRWARARPGLHLALIVFAVMLAAPTSSALAYYQMPIYGLSPANGSTLPLHPANNNTVVEIQSEPPPYYDLIAGLTVEVSRSTALGADGTLSDDNNVDSEYVYPSDGRPGIYRTTLQNFRPLYNSPGRYFFQFSGYTSSHQFVASPIYYYDLVNSLAAPTGLDTSMSKADAFGYIKALVKEHTHHRAARLHRSCRRTSASSFACSARFWGGSLKYSGHFRFKHAVEGGKVVWLGRFRGRKARRSCLHHHRFAACDKRVKWSDY